MTSGSFDTVLSTFQYNYIAGLLKQLTVTHSPHRGGQISNDENDDEVDDDFDEVFDDCAENSYIRNGNNNVLEERIMTVELLHNSRIEIITR